MDQNEFRKLKESGETVTDAALQEAETEIIPDDRYEEPEIEEPETEEEPTDELDEESEEELPELSEKEKTAFQLRLEREQKKIREQAEKELQDRYESQFSKHKKIVDLLGGDPDQVERMIEEQRQNSEITQRAQSLAYQNGWDEEQTHLYIQQEQSRLNEQRQRDSLQRELQELRIQNEINDLRDDSAYAGIREMRKEITDLVAKSGGNITVAQAYWALGGSKRAEQIRLEVQQREIARRSQTPRTVLKDTPGNNTGEKPLPSEILREAKQMGISEAEARRLYNSKSAQDIDEWRAQRKK